MISGCPTAPCLSHFVLRETQILGLPESRHFWVKEPLVCKENGGGMEKGAKSWSLSEGTNIRRCQGKLTGHWGQGSPYLDSNGIWFSCLITTKEKKIKNRLESISETPLCSPVYKRCAREADSEPMSLHHQLRLRRQGRGTTLLCDGNTRWLLSSVQIRQWSAFRLEAFLGDVNFSRH